jgi:hypothetical protein
MQGGDLSLMVIENLHKPMFFWLAIYSQKARLNNENAKRNIMYSYFLVLQ